MNITYFLGAGASVNIIPLANKMGKRMEFFCSKLKAWAEKNKLTSPLEKYIGKFESLLEEVNNSTSFDDYVKMLSINNEQPRNRYNLKVAKCFLNAYLLFEQTRNPKARFDKRYRTFFNSVIDPTTKLMHKNLSIITWNYDLQLEICYEDYADEYDIEKLQKKLRIFPSTNSPTDPKIMKLNGTAGLFFDKKDSTPVSISDMRYNNDEMFRYIGINIVANLRGNLSNPLLSFAWESPDAVHRVREFARLVIEQTKIMVIIGYSFPDLNQDIDKNLFSKVPRLERIYYQIPGNIDRIKAINPVLFQKTQHIGDVLKFHYDAAEFGE